MKSPDPPRTNGKTPMERMADLMRRVLAVPKEEVVDLKRKQLDKRLKDKKRREE